jgi:hypothetical protein
VKEFAYLPTEDDGSGRRGFVRKATKNMSPAELEFTREIEVIEQDGNYDPVLLTAAVNKLFRRNKEEKQ